MLISLFSQKIDKRMIGQLVADKHSMESGFPEGCQNAFLMKEPWEILCRSSRQKHRYTLVGGVALRGCIRESHDTLRFGKHRIGIPRIAIETEVMGSCRLSHYHHIHLRSFHIVLAPGIKPEVTACLPVILRCRIALESQIEIVADVDRIELIAHPVIIHHHITCQQTEEADSPHLHQPFANMMQERDR